jgi:hypothetical protein
MRVTSQGGALVSFRGGLPTSGPAFAFTILSASPESGAMITNAIFGDLFPRISD